MVAKTVDSYRFLHGVEKRIVETLGGPARGNTHPMDSFRHSAFEMYRVACKFSRDRLENRSPV